MIRALHPTGCANVTQEAELYKEIGVRVKAPIKIGKG